MIGYDVDPERIAELQRGEDRTEELNEDELRQVGAYTLTSDPAALAAASVYLVTVPTPINADRTPDLAPLEAASRVIAASAVPSAD